MKPRQRELSGRNPAG